MPLSYIVNGDSTDSSQYNALVDAIQNASTGHNHDGSSSRKINHGDLLDGAIGSGYSHASINNHINANNGVHGLASGHAPLAVTTTKRLLQYGTTVPNSGSYSGSVTFSVAYKSGTTPVIQMTGEAVAGQVLMYGFYLTSVSNTGFSWACTDQMVNKIARIHWYAIGELT